MVAVTASAPILLLWVSLLVGGGPRVEGADDALITLAMRDAAHGNVLVGPYSRFGWHHPGPSYLYLGSIPTRLWGGGPTGSWIAVLTVALVCAAGTAVVVRRAAGPRIGWWSAVVVLLVICGLRPGLFRDPWNPYAVVLPVLFVVIACGLAAAGARAALVWAAVVGSLAVQTHVSCAPLVLGLLAMAAGAQAVRAVRRHRDPREPPTHIPSSLPALKLPVVRVRWWRDRPEIALAIGLLVLEWIPPLWDEAFGSHNLTAIWNFFTAPHVGPSVDQAWREATAIFGITLFQHHRAFQDGVPDSHPLLTIGLFTALVLVAIVTGVRRHRPGALWLGVSGAVGAVLCVYSLSRVVGPPYRYLVMWMAVLPAVPLIGVAIGLEGIDVRALSRRLNVRIKSTAVVAVVVALVSLLGLRAVMDAPPAAALTDRDAQRGWQLLAPVVGSGHTIVRIELNDGGRWPTAAGLALELERHGHPARVNPPWTLLFGKDRQASGLEPDVIFVTSADPSQWPAPAVATPLGVAGRSRLFVARRGPPCWIGWVPYGGPACPVPAGAPAAGPRSAL